MANPDFSENKRGLGGRAKAPPKRPRGSTATNMPMKTPNWGGLPGKKQPGNRSGGTPRVQQHPQAEGL